MSIDEALSDFENESNDELRSLSKKTGIDYLDLMVENIRMRESYLTAYCIKHQHIPNEQEEIGVYRDVLKIIIEKYNDG